MLKDCFYYLLALFIFIVILVLIGASLFNIAYAIYLIVAIGFHFKTFVFSTLGFIGVGLWLILFDSNIFKDKK